MASSSRRGRRGWVTVAVLVALVALAGCSALGTNTGPPGYLAAPFGADGPIVLEILSSRSDQVTGGDALIRVRWGRQVRADDVVVTRNGQDVTAAFTPDPGGRSMTGLVTGLRLGWNDVATMQPYRVNLRLRNFPIEGPIFSGPKQYPFLCKTEESKLGQPLIDNQQGVGRRVYDANRRVIGWSRSCATPTTIDYQYRSTGGEFRAMPLDGTRPPDLAKTRLMDGRLVDYVVRVERGTINRFLYAIVMPVPFGEDPNGLPDHSSWNGRLVFRFDGATGIGHDQGQLEPLYYMDDRVLSKGYAVVFTTGVQTTIHFNLMLAGETALMTKERFIERHGPPLYTVGVGISGGGLEQYVFAQNHPGQLIDAAIPQASYPDLETQAIFVGDCELLERYMDASDNPKWDTWTNRRLLIGLNASDTVRNTYNNNKPGSDECVNAWRGIVPLAMNPNFTFDYDSLLWPQVDPPGTEDKIYWTHWDDLVNIYGLDDDGFARNPWGNEGVQYGLRALVDGKLAPAEFLDVNAKVGSWRESADMVAEGCPFMPTACPDPAQMDPWSSRNMHLSPDNGKTPAPRRTADPTAVEAALRAGLVFRGDVDIPIIDWRVYEENKLSTHHARASFVSRKRMLDVDGIADNHVIWFAPGPSPHDPLTSAAFEAIDDWMANIAAHPERGVAGNKPPAAVDSCFDKNEEPIATGPEVWAGIIDDRAAGACTKEFPIHETSRTMAGGPIEGDVFACKLQPVADAIAAGIYGSWHPTAAQQARLEQIFPTGVCDYD